VTEIGAIPFLESGRRQRERRVLYEVLALNIAVAVGKLLYAGIAGSVAMAADGVHSLLDSASNVVGLVGLYIAHKPPDAGHPYGHRKFEILASLAIGVMILFAGVEIGRKAVAGFAGERAPDIGPAGFAIAGGTLLINLFVTLYESRMGRRLRSPILLADARHTLSDVLATTLVLLSFVAVRLGYPEADPVAAILVLGVIVLAAYRIFRSGVDVLVDGARLEVEEIGRIAGAVPGVRGCRRIRSRGLEREVAVDLVILVDPALTVAAAHDIADRVEEALRRAWPEVSDIVVHVEPEG
jgi:cation diffusion facilitator family transporter